jgi:hypothetical protein
VIEPGESVDETHFAIGVGIGARHRPDAEPGAVHA